MSIEPQNSERGRFGRLQAEDHSDCGGPVERPRGPGGRVQDPTRPHGPRLETALPGPGEEAGVRRRGRDRRLGVVRLIYGEKVVRITVKKSDMTLIHG